MSKFVFVTGGVVSSLGKGITAASIGRLLKSRGLRVSMKKFDPYINIDPGLLSPLQHGEAFVTEDGGQCDLDVGHYERFIDENLGKYSDITTGTVYWNVLTRERQGFYNGRTVQVIPDITNEINRFIQLEADETGCDVLITEIGGTVGDIEGLPFYEAIRQFAAEREPDTCLFIHVTLVPYLRKAEEIKTKPTQHSVKALLSIGIQPDIIVCRTEVPLEKDTKQKIGLFCNVPASHVVENMDCDYLYEIPLMLENEGLAELVCSELKLKCDPPELSQWIEMVEKIKRPKEKVIVGLVGKYTDFRDAYLSVVEAIKHGAIANEVEVGIRWIAARDVVEGEMETLFAGIDAMIVPGAFDKRDIEGKINAIQYARENNIPFLGLGMGMQMAAVEIARHVKGWQDAHSTEINPATQYPLVMLPSQLGYADAKDELRLGAWPTTLAKNSLAADIYNTEVIVERHRHRYEMNEKLVAQLSDTGLVITGINEEQGFIDVLEYTQNDWFVGVSYHPEYKSRPTRPHPLFAAFVKAAMAHHHSVKA